MIKEVLIAAHNSRSGYTLEGDVLDIRDPIGAIGRKERLNYLLVLMDDSDLPNVEDLHDLSDSPQLGRKHFYNIPLLSIPGITAISILRARNPLDSFQIGALDETSGRVRNIPTVTTRPNRKL